MLNDVLRQIRSVRAHSNQKSRAARPLPASADKVQARDGGDAALVNKTSALVLDLGNRHPVGVVSIPSRPDYSIDLGRFSTCEVHLLPFGSDDTAYHDHTSLSKLL